MVKSHSLITKVWQARELSVKWAGSGSAGGRKLWLSDRGEKAAHALLVNLVWWHRQELGWRRPISWISWTVHNCWRRQFHWWYGQKLGWRRPISWISWTVLSCWRRQLQWWKGQVRWCSQHVREDRDMFNDNEIWGYTDGKVWWR